MVEETTRPKWVKTYIHWVTFDISFQLNSKKTSDKITSLQTRQKKTIYESCLMLIPSHYIKITSKQKMVHYVLNWSVTWENVHSDMCAQQDSNQPALPCSLIRVFVVSMKKPCIFGYPNWAQWRSCSDCANAQADLKLCWVHMFEGMFLAFN